MITHRDEIFSRPKRTWFVTEKEKKLVANAGKVIFLCHIRFYLYVTYYLEVAKWTGWVG